MTKCIILAAGAGSRLKPYTDNDPKGLVNIFGKPIIYHQIEKFNNNGITNIAIVTGSHANKFNQLSMQKYHNHNHASTNMVASLFSARDFFENSQEDLLISYGDIIFQQNNLQKVISTEGDVVVMVDNNWIDLWSARNDNPLNDAETLRFDQDNNISEIGKKPTCIDEIQGQFTGLIKISKKRIKDCILHYEKLKLASSSHIKTFNNLYMTDFIQSLIDDGWKIKPAKVSNGWLEVDTVSDLELYENLKKANMLENLYDFNL